MKVICQNCNTEQEVNTRRTPLSIARCEKCGKVRLMRKKRPGDHYEKGRPWRVNGK